MTKTKEKAEPWPIWFARTRKEAKLRKCQLADMAGCHPSYITMIENRGQVPSRKTTKRLGMALGCVDTCMRKAGYTPEESSPSPGYIDRVNELLRSLTPAKAKKYSEFFIRYVMTQENMERTTL